MKIIVFGCGYWGKRQGTDFLGVKVLTSEELIRKKKSECGRMEYYE